MSAVAPRHTTLPPHLPPAAPVLAESSGAELRQLLENLPVGAYTCDAEGLITYCNPRAVELWGRAPRLNDPLDRFCGSFQLYTIDGCPLAHAQCWTALALKERREYSREEVVIRKPNGEQVVALVHVKPLFDQGGALSGAVNVMVDITRRKSAEKALQRARDRLAQAVSQRTAQLTELSHYLIRVAEEEKQRLASELHDELGALHTVIGMDLQAVLDELRQRAPDLVPRQLNAITHLNQARDIKRRIIADLRPVMLDHLGLLAAIEDHVQRWSRASGVRAELHLAQSLPPLANDVALALFRVVQESLTNVSKYARAASVSVTIAVVAETLELVVADDGVGIVPGTLENPRSHGILGMRQRMAQAGGTLVIGTGRNGTGTAVRVRLPLPAH
jgi:signal transduction histidine kinase